MQARETLVILTEMKRRKKNLAEKLKELVEHVESVGASSLRKEINGYDKDINELESRKNALSIRGAVGYPFTSFLLALLIASYGICIYPFGWEIWAIISAFFNGLGIYFLKVSLVAIEKAVMRPKEKLLPEFRVSFLNGSKIQRFSPDKVVDVNLLITNVGNQMAENVLAMFAFPPEFQLRPHKKYKIVKQIPTSAHPEYNSLVIREKCIHAKIAFTPETVHLKTPNVKKLYSIPVTIRTKRIGVHDDELKILIA